MADTFIGFSEQSDFDRMSKSVRKSENMQGTGSRQRSKYPLGGGGGGTDEIIFEIVSVDCEADPITAIVLVIANDCGKDTVPGEDEAEQVMAEDLLGCNLNEPEGDLIGRRGYARRMKTRESGTGTGTGACLECCWQIKFICCDEDACG